MPLVAWILKNPVPVLGALLLALFLYQNHQVKSLKAENLNLKTEISQVKVDQKTTLDNVRRLDNLETAIANTRSTQTIIRERIQDVPVLGEDRPFVSDPALLDRADIMRDTQERYKSPGSK